VPPGFATLVLDERTGAILRLEVGAEDLGARGAQLLADQRGDRRGLVAASLLVVGRIVHHPCGYRSGRRRNSVLSQRAHSVVADALTMTTHIRKLVAAFAATVLVGFAAGCGGSGATSDATTNANATNNAQQRTARAAGPGGGGLSTTTLRTLATKLGVSTAQLQKAMAAARPTGTPGGTPPAQGSAPAAGTTGPAGDMAAAIAKSLGLTTAKVQAALTAVMPAGGGGPGGAPPSGAPATGTATTSSS
jgi:hypothetical protein